MENKREFTGVISAAKDFFGLMQGQTLTDFAAEWKSLSPADQKEIREGLERIGYVITTK